MIVEIRAIISLLSFVGFWLPFLSTPFGLMLGSGCVVWCVSCFITLCAVAGDSSK
jgi:hypothetical protein